MSKIEKIIENLSFPLSLPEDAFILFGKERRVPDFDLIVKQLPLEIREELDPNATASGGGVGTYLLPLMSGQFLRLKIEEHKIVEIAVVDHWAFYGLVKSFYKRYLAIFYALVL